MPEYPDITVYVERSRERLQGQVLRQVQLLNPFVLRTAVPPIAQAEGRAVTAARNLGKRVVLALEGDWYLVMHLMIAGRLRWLAAPVQRHRQCLFRRDPAPCSPVTRGADAGPAAR